MLGWVRHWVTVYLNVPCHQCPTDAVFELVFKQTFINQLFYRIVGKPLHSSTSLDLLPVLGHLENCAARLEHHLGLNEVLRLRSFDQAFLHPLAAEVLCSVKSNVSTHFQDRMSALFACWMEQRAWSQRGTTHFQRDLKLAGKCYFKAVLCLQPEDGSDIVSAWCTAMNRASWENVLNWGVTQVRHMFEPLRRAAPPSDLPELAALHPYVYNVKSRHCTLVKLLQEFQKVMLPVMELRKNAAVECSRVPKSQRKALWTQMLGPGMMTAPRIFYLLPISSLTRAFIYLKPKNMCRLLRLAYPEGHFVPRLSRDIRKWWMALIGLFQYQFPEGHKYHKQVKRSHKKGKKRTLDCPFSETSRRCIACHQKTTLL